MRVGDKSSSLCHFFQKQHRGVNRGQVWIETVIYTLIALVMIGAVLAVAMPTIQKIQDQAVVEQSIEMIKDIDSLVFSVVQGGPGNKRLIDVGIKKGMLRIDGVEDKLLFEIESQYPYSELGLDLSEDGLIIRTEQLGKLYFINMTKDYSGKYNITFQNKDEIKSLSKGTTAYGLLISNNGKEGNLTKIDISVN